MNQANFLFGNKVIIMIIFLVITKEKSFGTNSNQENWLLVIRLLNEWVAEGVSSDPPDFSRKHVNIIYRSLLYFGHF